MVETKIKDDVRAFRAYLGAFRLAPEDQGLIDYLWRLAEKIGTHLRTPAPLAVPRAALKEGKSEPAHGDKAGAAKAVESRRSSSSQELAALTGSEPMLELDGDQITGEIDLNDVDIMDEVDDGAESDGGAVTPAPA